MEFKNFNELTHKNIGSIFSMKGKVEVIKQTSGPTLMILNDGTANFTFKAFVKPGVRAYPEIEIGNCVKVEAQINERNDNIEGEVKFMKKLQDNEEKAWRFLNFIIY